MACATSSDQHNNNNNDFILVSMYLALRQLANWGHFPTYWHMNLFSTRLLNQRSYIKPKTIKTTKFAQVTAVTIVIYVARKVHTAYMFT